MKIGIVTPFDSANYGAFLQAYATKLFLEEQGHCVYFVKWRSSKERKGEFFVKPKSFKLLLRFIQKFPFLCKKYKIFSESIEVFNQMSLDEIENIDALVVGSDEVWNISETKFQKPIFYLTNINERIKKYAYAPSIGSSVPDMFGKYSKVCEGIHNIEIIGVRDDATKNIVNSLTQKQVNIVCDPTLLLEKADWKWPKRDNSIGKYILVYSYDVPKKHKEYLLSIAKRIGAKLVAIGLYKPWCDMNINCHPLEFNAYIENAECVYTTTFHGTIFTVLNHKKCVLFAQSQKVNYLIQQYGLDDLKVPLEISENDFEGRLLLEFCYDYNQFEEKLAIIRKYSRELYIDKMSNATK